jgi:hypothetical protein
VLGKLGLLLRELGLLLCELGLLLRELGLLLRELGLLLRELDLLLGGLGGGGDHFAIGVKVAQLAILHPQIEVQLLAPAPALGVGLNRSIAGFPAGFPEPEARKL